MRKNFHYVLPAVLLAAAFGFLIPACSSGGDSGSDFVGTFDSTGSWKGTYKIDSLSVSGGFTVAVVQTSGKITGTITISRLGLSDAAITGNVSSNNITFGDISGIVSFSGEADVFDTASGTFTAKYLGSSYSGTWTGTCIRTLTLVKSFTLPDYLDQSSHFGLAWDGTGFWVSDSQRLAKVDANGNLLSSFMYNDLQWPLRDFEALVWDGTNLYAIEDGIQEDYTKAKFFKINRTTGEASNPLPCPPDGSTSNTSPFGLGFAWDGSTLYCLRYSGGGTSLIYKTDRATGASLGTVSVPVPTSAEGGTIMAGGFGAMGTDLYIANRAGIPIFKFRSSDGKIVRRFTYAGWDFSASPTTGSPGGITSDGTYLWVRDTMQGKLLAFTMPTGLAP